MSEEKFRKFSEELGKEIEKLLDSQMMSVKGGNAEQTELPCQQCKTACSPGCQGTAVGGQQQ
jgi:hypothetical protein